MQTIHYFAGGNTAQGFFSCFDDILPMRERKRVYIIKGGPGVGKSTLMKRVAQAAEEKGYAVEYFHCSSDPASLDGICFPQHGIALMDGTAPHIQDPVIPGARDTLLSLGDFLDEEALLPHAGEIDALQKQISARFARCYRYLSAAREVRAAAPAGVENETKALQMAQDWAKALPLRGGRGGVRRLLGTAFTPEGLQTVTDFSQFERRVTLDVPFGAHADMLMTEAVRQAVQRGLDTIALLDALEPDHIAHVLIPAHGVALCTGQKTAASPDEWLEAETVFDPTSSGEKERGFDVNAYELLCQRAMEQLHAAHSLHDELERFYIKQMDFAKWQTVLEKVTASLP